MSDVNKKLAHIFEQMGLIYEIKDDKYRQRAYHRGAEVLGDYSQDVEKVYEEKNLSGLKELPGIGQAMAEKIEEFIKTKKIKEYENLKKEIPVELEELSAVEGVGPKMIKVLYKELGVKNLKDLERAARFGKIRNLEGFGEKTENNIIQGIAFLQQEAGRMLLGDVLPYARDFIEKIKKIEGVKEVCEAGSLRRRKETIGDIDILVVTADSKKVFEKIAKLPSVQKIWGRGETKLSVHFEHGFDMDVRAVDKKSYGAALQYFTGSKAHNVHLRKIATGKGYKLNEYGLFQIQKLKFKTQNHNLKLKNNENLVAGKTEEEIYKVLGLKVIPPEMREDSGEIELAQKGKIPQLIECGDLKGDLQVQTNWTDGRHSIEEMAIAARDAGLKYILITDHTKRLAMTGGLSDKKVLEQKRDIEKLNRKLEGITILSGAEVDILKDGSLDLKDETLKQLDVVGASVHSYFKLSRIEQTERVIKAIKNPHVDILFHPTGRRINRRPPIDIDMEHVIKVAQETGTILEINSSPGRLDLKDDHIKMAREMGCKFAISSDAHSRSHYKFLEYGVAQARRGWVEARDVVNTYPPEEMLRFMK
ncbi:MAG: hypothetical protein A3F94_00685 [Candidatus Spechtbacteria bacterium RIFCSPLOWO2_12_FULL_38_22]|uniref:DNA polymerase beta n=1 Tax=Candidatus Spechtbacteria bacterium RIFCSPLOWO2_12_FULL_38_22 TaxID=1802165 RepID=A0A1G2HI03_9BACT|nr:MAG: hypothetical protein A2728_02890 [Candidatus Spechtbacteria bacterium RIFCSPHIGHO2_01_FULL_38_11]OGZ60014.1 MAG: hypothetical protein A3E58_01560 [Candidatus Spechtbacteria bacterium RIFCSPHIGHO2_12_FULL_38_30]OGZ60700.1 MAG: hypothetical protein A3A00_02095 [Candidatus Spechtbacteria bacterium RIFCSPLOWO2_01_FULL_38_20]OGZ61910.1 MAG: hypothetical protein A3F94_00685 [Candidatus Spechtbacteria bacterium RIFCSPLOWO2_12_FULL_38_22]